MNSSLKKIMFKFITKASQRVDAEVSLLATECTMKNTVFLYMM